MYCPKTQLNFAHTYTQVQYPLAPNVSEYALILSKGEIMALICIVLLLAP